MPKKIVKNLGTPNPERILRLKDLEKGPSRKCSHLRELTIHTSKIWFSRNALLQEVDLAEILVLSNFIQLCTYIYNQRYSIIKSFGFESIPQAVEHERY